MYGFAWNAPLNPTLNSRLSASVNNNKYDLDLLSGFAPVIEPMMNIKIIYDGGRTIIPSDIQFALRRDTSKIPVTNVIEFLKTICTYTTANPIIPLNKASQLLGTLDIPVSEDMVFTLSKNYEAEQSSNISNISKKFFTDLNKSKKEQKEGRDEEQRIVQEQEQARIMQEQEQIRLLQIAQEQEQARIMQEQARLAQIAQEERQRLIQANMPFKSRRLQRDIRKNISNTKEDIISKFKKSKTFTITDNSGKIKKKLLVPTKLLKLEEVSNSNSNETSS